VIEELVPACVATVEASEDPAGLPGLHLYPEEMAVIANAVEGRQREFATVRLCARRAMSRLGLPPMALVPGQRGAPRWPDGVVGSMTHCDSYRAAAVARAHDLVSIGIDAEPNRPLPDGVLDVISLRQERKWVSSLLKREPEVRWDRLVFSAKESVFKAWYPLTHRALEFDQALIEVAQDSDRFSARLLVPGPTVAGTRLNGFTGRWTCRDGLVATAITLITSSSRPPAANYCATSSSTQATTI
jgi:4'-phosphopantetheinyl transferase EntD